MSKWQASLFKYGFTKKVKHRNTLVNISVGDHVHETGIHTQQRIWGGGVRKGRTPPPPLPPP